jgi:hypothetical protein
MDVDTKRTLELAEDNTRAILPSSSTNPFVFLMGNARSGTTLLKRLVDGHPQIAIAPGRRRFLRQFMNRVGLTPDGFVTPEMVLGVGPAPAGIRGADPLPAHGVPAA